MLHAGGWLTRSILAALVVALVAVLPGQATPAGADDIQPRSWSTVPAIPAGLDRTGQTLPTTNYPIPDRAVFMSPNGSDLNPGTLSAPVQTLNRSVSLAPAGGTIVLRGGEYYDWYHNPNGTGYGVIDKDLTFQAYPGEAPWLNGSNPVSPATFRKARNSHYYLTWSTPEFCDGRYYSRRTDQQQVSPNEGPCSHFDMSRDPGHPMAGDPQMVFVDGRALHQVQSPTALTPETFYYDWARQRIVLNASPEGKQVEITRRPVALVLAQANYRVLGLGFRKYASNEFGNTTTSALRIAGSRSLVENSVFTGNAALGLTYSNPQPGSVVRRSVFAGNGYTALGGFGGAQAGARNDLTVEQNIFSANNAERFGTNCSSSCGAAAAKFAGMVGLTLRGNLVEETQGAAAGLWCDLDCRDTNFVYNTVRNNSGGPAIVYEVSDRGIIAGNVLTGSTYGIAVASSNTKIYHNTLVGNVQGINVYDDQRSVGVNGWHDVGPDTRNVEVVNNVVSGGGYSLMASSSRINAPSPNTGGDEVLARVDHNAFHQSNGPSPIFTFWRTRQGTVTFFRSQATFTAARGFERHGRWLTGSSDPLFENQAGGDLRMRHRVVAPAELPADVAAALWVSRSPFGRGIGAFAQGQ